MEWKEGFFEEIENFRKMEIAQTRNHHQRLIWVKNQEINADFQIGLIPRECRPLYKEAKTCFIHGAFRGSIVILETALTTLLFKNIKIEHIRDKWPKDAILMNSNRTGKNSVVKIKNIRDLTLNNLINLAEEKEVIPGDLARELHIFRWIRIGVVHYELVQKSHLGAKLTSIRGTGTQVRGYTFETPFTEKQIVIDKNGNKKVEEIRILIKFYSLFEGSQKGFEEFFNLFTHLYL